MIRYALLPAALFLPAAANAQIAFDPSSVAYVLCVTTGTKKFALETPPIAKDDVVDKAFAACRDTEADARKFLAGKGLGASEIDGRFLQIKKFIRQTAQNDIDRVRANTRPR